MNNKYWDWREVSRHQNQVDHGKALAKTCRAQVVKRKEFTALKILDAEFLKTLSNNIE